MEMNCMLSSQLILTLSFITVGGFAAMGVRYAWGRIQTMDDYITARGTTESITLSATLLASFLGVFILFTPAEAAIFGGIPAIIGYALGPVALYWVLMELAPRMKQYLPTGSSLTDFAWVRYGKSMYLLTVLLSLFYMFVHLVAELTAIALVAQQLSGIPLWQTALLVGLGTVLYTAYGGLKASMFTDSVQMKMTVFLLFLIAVSSIAILGGWNRIHMAARVNGSPAFDPQQPGRHSIWPDPHVSRAGVQCVPSRVLAEGLCRQRQCGGEESFPDCHPPGRHHYAGCRPVWYPGSLFRCR
jgi:Na+/proline symporter